MAEQIPVYLFTGFLEAGKTKFIQETMEDPRFNEGERTLLLICEEGLEEYSPASFINKRDVYIKTLEKPEELTSQQLSGWQKQYHIQRVVLEYNGMWPMEKLFSAMPEVGCSIRTFCLWMPAPFCNTMPTCGPWWWIKSKPASWWYSTAQARRPIRWSSTKSCEA